MNQFLSPIVSGVRGRRTPVSVHGLGAMSISTILVGALFALPTNARVVSPSGFVPVVGFQGVVVSTSSDLVLSSTAEIIDDSALLRVEAGSPVRIPFQPGHWQGVSGDVPGDIDGLARRPSANPSGHQALAFTLQGNEFGFLDGDVLGLAQGGGFEVLIFESDIQDELGTPGASIDLDAIAYDAQGRLLFSLQADLASTVVGDVQDGDILRMELGGGVTRIFTEAEVQAGVSAVTGSSSAINDVLGIDVVGGDIWVSVQSPSAVDGSVFSLGASPAMILAEVDAGLDGAEIDALMWSDPLSEIGVLHFDVYASTPGSAVLAEFSGGRPNGRLYTFVAGGTGFTNTAGLLTGFDGIYIDPTDPWFNSLVPIPIIRLDGNGEFQGASALPVNNMGGVGFDGSMGWSFQTIDVMTLEVSAPFRIEL